jgi:S1-C subfamily serine protease
MIRNSNGRLIANEEAIFPIITFIDRTGFHGLGTGFFINEHGGFLTAKHVFIEPNGEHVPRLYGVQTLNTGERIVRELRYLYPHPEADIAHGMLGRVVNNNGEYRLPPLAETLAITLDAVGVTDTVNTYGYPIQNVEDPQMTMVTMGFQGITSEGRVLQYCSEGSLRTRNACYETTLVTQSGHSGGPVIRNNIVIGVNSSSYQGDTPSYFTPLNPFILDLQARDSDGTALTFREIFARQQR